MKKSVSIIVSAYNEEDNIKNAVKSVLKATATIVADFEIIIVNDGSTDKTLQISKKLQTDKHIRLINHPKNQGVGKSFQDGVVKATKKYIAVFPGDNDMSSNSLRDLFKKIDAADLIISYPKDQFHRSYIRRMLSNSFTRLMNVVFRSRLKYYNGPFIVKTALIRNLELRSEGFLIFAEFKLKLIQAGYSFIEIPFEHVGRKHGESKAVSLHNLVDTIKIIMQLYIDKILKKW